MKLAYLIFIIALFQSHASSYSQNTKISLEMRDVTIETVLNKIEEKTGHKFLYEKGVFQTNKVVSISAKKEKLSLVLDRLFKSLNVNIHYLEKQIIIKRMIDRHVSRQVGSPPQHVITGNVTDKNELPLAGANIIIKGSTVGTLTDFDGNYEITANEGQILVFSYVGMIPEEKVVDATVGTINIKLLDANELEEVVVVAYGTQTKESVVGAVATVSEKVIQNQQVTSPLKALQGLVPGVNVLSTNGEPGSNPSIRIRGFGSINAAQSPLIVIDGAAFNGNINVISQDQIESITVLKDASSTSLYGSRGANGVILITTKKGKKNTAPSVTFRTQVGFSSPAVDLPDFLETEDLMKLTWEALRNTNQYVRGQEAGDAGQNASDELIDYLGYNPYNVNNPIDANGNLVPGASLLWDTDWESELIRNNALRTNHNLSVSGGDERSTYLMSFDYLNEEGTSIGTDFERAAVSLNLESQVTDWLTVGLNTSFSRSKSNLSNPNNVESINWIYNVSSIYPIYARDADGNLHRDNEGNLIFDYGNGTVEANQIVNSIRPGSALAGFSELGSINLGIDKRKRINYLGSAFAEVQIIDGLKFKTQFNYQHYLYDDFEFDDDLFGFASEAGGRIEQRRDITTTVNAIQSLNFAKDFGTHHISTDLLTEAYTVEIDRLTARASGFLPNVTSLNGNTTPEITNGFVQEERLNSYLGRFAYNYDKRYFAEFSARRDGSSRFSEETRWGNFFSMGASWIVSNERFLQNNKVLSFLKLRASYGELGNNRGIGFFPYQAVFNSGWNNEGNSGVLLTEVADPRISWEKTASTNLGVDFSLFDGKISGTVDYYDRESVDLIYDKPLPTSTGVDEITTNVGAVRNYGLEVSLNTTNISTENFTWNTGINFSLDKNEITELTQDEFISGTKLFKVGNSLFDFYLQEWAGVDPTDGQGMWFMDILNDDGEVVDKVTTKDQSQATRYLKGSALPDVIGGFSTFFKYKQFDLNILANFSFGGELYNGNYGNLINTFNSPGSTAHVDNLNRWQQPGDITNTPLLLASPHDHSFRSTRFLFTNNYVRLRSLTLGYNFDRQLLEKFGCSSLRLFIQADNLFTFQSLKGIDPEHGFSGVVNSRPRIPKIIAGGLTVTF
ncbi:SusC/RagA family TonB-linked outer membrane protein [Flagellimonas onchidii]|uniref:SusC/RagA family TonB-linked outer membrane protein n=1 Tax=Flagellimonas onchidii TaxID=2562684 RepID=UPI001455F41F|nr:TonB-dependent receptor [Allomuricauda onchidii]